MSFKTYKGTEFNYNNPTKEMIDIDDIVLSLSRINRFVGHSSRAYSVAEHSINCYIMAEKLGYSTREQLLVLVHDFTEAYVNDCPSPLKKLLPEFEVIERNVELAIYDYIGIDVITLEEHMKVKSIDLTMLAIEMRDLTRHDWKDFVYDISHLDMIEDKEFDIRNSKFGETALQSILKGLYNNLVDDLKKQ